jgi:MFS family permease
MKFHPGIDSIHPSWTSRGVEMNSLSHELCSSADAARVGKRLGARASFLLLASITTTFVAGSISPTPLYPLYQAQWGMSATGVTLVFGIYAVAVLASLLGLGRLSDRIGRRPVLFATLVAQVLAMGLLGTAGGFAGLIVARVVQGLATGAAIAAVGAGLLDLDKARGATANAITPPVGTALGGIVAGVVVRYLPAPAHLIFALLSAVYVLQAIGVLFLRESVRAGRFDIAALRPQLGVPAAVRPALVAAAPVLVAAWALAGFYASLGPTLVHGLLPAASPLMSGLTVFVLAASAAGTVVALNDQSPRGLMATGTLLLLAGVGLDQAAVALAVPAAFFLGTAVAGAGFGAGFQGAVRTVVAATAPGDRAGVISVVFVISYLAMGVPAVVAGYFVAHHHHIFATTQDFGGVVMALAALSLLASLRPARTGAGKL